MNATAETSFRFESLVRTISRGIPGLTSAALMYSVPRSMPNTAEAADAVPENRMKSPSNIERVEKGVRRRPGGAIVNLRNQAAELQKTMLICPEARDVRGRTPKSKNENRIKYAEVKKGASPERGSSLELSQAVIYGTAARATNEHLAFGSEATVSRTNTHSTTTFEFTR